MTTTKNLRHNVKRPTLTDVAEHASVSYQTVSRVINHHPSVATKTRTRVLKAIAELGYRPNQAAQSLVTRRSKTVGIISSGTKYYGPAQMVTNIETALKARGYGLAVATLEEPTLEQMHSAVDQLNRQSVDGFILITPIQRNSSTEISQLLDSPFIMVDIKLGEQIPSVIIDQRYGAKIATQHLLDLGHRDVCEISGPLTWSDAEQRHQGWLLALREAGIDSCVSVESDWTAAGGYAATRQLLEKTSFTALFVGNDQMALGAMRAFWEHGLRVPDDVSIVGFDDVPEAAFYTPPLTTVRQDFTTLGRQSVEYLMALIQAPHTPTHQRVLYPELVARHSTSQLE